MFRKTIFNLHLCLGLLAAAFLGIQGLTGALLVFENELTWAMNRKTLQVDPGPSVASLAKIQSELESQYAGYRVTGFQLPPGANIAGIATLAPANGDSITVSYNPYTATPIATLNESAFPLVKVRQFHKRLWGGALANGIVGWSSVILLVLSTTGLVLWWPRRILTMTWSSRARRTFDLHNSIGFYAAAFLFLFGLTGVVVHWENAAQNLVARMTHAVPAAPMEKPSLPAAGATPLDAQQVLTMAEFAAPGAHATMMRFALKPDGPVRVTMKYPEDHTPAGRTNVLLDAYTGRVLSLRSSRTAPLDFKLVKLWNRQVHTGDIFGWPTRILAFVFSLMLPLMAITGPMLWWRKLRRGGSRAKEREKALAIA